MQKFGLQRNSSSQLSFIEKEIIKERACALGRAGRKLRQSLEKYENERHNNLSPDSLFRLVKEISNNVWELVLQRELIGFVEGNMDWIKKNYVIPEAAIKLLGHSS